MLFNVVLRRTGFYFIRTLNGPFHAPKAPFTICNFNGLMLVFRFLLLACIRTSVSLYVIAPILITLEFYDNHRQRTWEMMNKMRIFSNRTIYSQPFSQEKDFWRNLSCWTSRTRVRHLFLTSSPPHDVTFTFLNKLPFNYIKLLRQPSTADVRNNE